MRTDYGLWSTRWVEESGRTLTPIAGWMAGWPGFQQKPLLQQGYGRYQLVYGARTMYKVLI